MAIHDDVNESYMENTLRRIRQAAEFCKERSIEEYEGNPPRWCRCDTILKLLNEGNDTPSQRSSDVN